MFLVSVTFADDDKQYPHLIGVVTCLPMQSIDNVFFFQFHAVLATLFRHVSSLTPLQLRAYLFYPEHN